MRTERSDAGDVRVRDDGGCRFHCGFARILRDRVREHPVLDRTQADDRQRSDADQDRSDHESLTALAPHGIHSMRRDALAVTTNWGSPMIPSGTGTV